MSPHSIHPHKRVPKPQLLSLDLPLSLPSPVGNLLNPVVQIGSSSNPAPNQPPKQNPPPKPSPGPSPSLTPSTSPPSPSSPPSPPSSGGSSRNGGNGGSSNGGNQSSGNGSNGTNGNQGNGNGQGNNNGNDNNGGQSNTANGNGTPSQSGTASSTGNSGSAGSGGQSQPSSNEPIPGVSQSSPSSGTTSGATSSPSNVSNNSNGGATNSEPASPLGPPLRGDISSPNESGDPVLQSGNAASGNNNPSKPGQPSTGSSSGNSPSDPSNPFNTVDGGGSSPLSGSATISTNSPAVTNDPTSSGATGSKSHAGGIAAGITVSLITVALIACILFFLRRRHQRKQADRRVTWITGFVDGQAPDMVERSSIRSSWGTPIERLTWARTPNDDPFVRDFSQNTLPVLPLPVHSPLDVGRPDSASPEVPENPFSDVPANAQGSLHPCQVPFTLPIRLSLISAGSCQDPFDDVNRTAEPISNSDGGQTTFELNSKTTGHGPSQANFPLPPSTPASVKSGIAIGSPSDLGPHKELLATPSMTFSFPDSPISPTFASPDTASYPHRVSVKHDFRASQARSDEIHLEKGEEVNVVSVYEDGWAFVQKEKDNERGLVPLNCLDL